MKATKKLLTIIGIITLIALTAFVTLKISTKGKRNPPTVTATYGVYCLNANACQVGPMVKIVMDTLLTDPRDIEKNILTRDSFYEVPFADTTFADQQNRKGAVIDSLTKKARIDSFHYVIKKEFVIDWNKNIVPKTLTR